MNLQLNFVKRKQLTYHIIGWTIFIAYEVSFIKLIRWGDTDISVWNGYIIPYFINICLFYFHAFLTMHFCFGKASNKIILFIFLTLVEFSLYLLLMGIKGGINNKQDFFSTLYPRIDLIRQIWRGIYFLIFSSAFWLIHKSFKKEQMLKEAKTNALLREKEKKELELKLISTQNAFLQSQINPHLLFNTLNFIHSEVQQVSTKASDAIIVLSDMMRYSLAEIKADGKVLLDKEIEQIHNLVRINQFRFNNKLYINFKNEGEYATIWIVPLLLIPFVENLFKYAEIMDEADPAKIEIEVNRGVLYFKTFNKKRKTTNYASSSIGIENVKTRLNSYYHRRFTLDINNLESTFSVNLMIQLKPTI